MGKYHAASAGVALVLIFFEKRITRVSETKATTYYHTWQKKKKKLRHSGSKTEEEIHDDDGTRHNAARPRMIHSTPHTL